jgi:hypothetical protein
MDKVQKYNSFNTNTPSSESYRNYLCLLVFQGTVPAGTKPLHTPVLCVTASIAENIYINYYLAAS